MTSSYFDNIQDVLIGQIALSQHNICIAVAWFTNDLLFEALKDALNNKVKVKVYFAPITSDEYIIKSRVIAIASYAFNWHYYRSGGGLFTNRYTHEKKITRLLIPDSVIAIGSESFSDNTAINDIIVSNKLEYIGQRAFSGCKKMMDFNLPSTVKYIETEAFNGCWNAFKELTIPASVRHIGSHAFKGCITLEKVIFSGPIDKIGSGIFESCDKLSEIVVPKECVEQFREQLPFYSEIIIEASEEE